MTNLTTEQGGVQAESAAESEAQGAFGGGQTSANAEVREGSTQGQEGNTSGSLLEAEGKLPPELEETRKQLMEAFHEKTQKLAEERRSMEAQYAPFREKADMLDRLMGEEWFAQALEARRSGRGGGQASGLSAEDLEKAGIGTEQAAAFEKIVQSRLNAELKKLSPYLQKHEQALQALELEKEQSELRKAHSDFSRMEKSEAFLKYRKQGYDSKAAYALAKLELGPQSSTQEAEAILAARKAASVAKGGPTKVDGKKVVKSRNYRETMDALFDVLKAGGSSESLEIDYARD